MYQKAMRPRNGCRRCKQIASGLGLCIAGLIARPVAASEYAVFDLGPLLNISGGHNATVAAVDASGQVSMTYSPDGVAYSAYRFSNGSALSLGTLGGANSFAGGINSADQVVGRSQAATGGTHAFVWTSGGTGGVASNPQMKDLNPTGGTSAATAINSTGQIAGYIAVSPSKNQPAQDRAFLYSNGNLTQLPLPTGGFSVSYAYSLNDSGKVVGEAYTGQSALAHGFFYDGSSSVQIGDLGGGSSTPLAINKNDRAVGYSSNADGYDHAFTYQAGSLTDLGTLGGHYSYANSINNNDQVVGGSFADRGDSVFHAFVSDGVNMTDLNTKITSNAVNWVLNEAKGINDSGVIAGTGTLWGQKHGFMLMPLTPGDANADGKVNFSDLVTVAQNYGSMGADWEHGDFNGDGNVGFADLVTIAQNYGSSQAGFPAPFEADVQSAFASIPEPNMASAGMAVCLFAARRRRGR